MLEVLERRMRPAQLRSPEGKSQEHAFATVRVTLGSLDKVKRVVKVLGMVNSAPGFTDQPKVINGFSDLMVEVLRRGNR